MSNRTVPGGVVHELPADLREAQRQADRKADVLLPASNEKSFLVLKIAEPLIK